MCEVLGRSQHWVQERVYVTVCMREELNDSREQEQDKRVQEGDGASQ